VRAPRTEAPAPAPTSPIGAARASIAVLPLEALGAEAGGDYFADGLTEDIIAALGRFRDLSVMSLGAVFGYKGKHPPPAEVGPDLRVRYVVEGFVRRGPERIRVSLSLIDTNRNTVLWSEKYEAEPKDIFAVQDDITRRVAGALALRVTSLELERSAVKPPNNLEAYDLVLRVPATRRRAPCSSARSRSIRTMRRRTSDWDRSICLHRMRGGRKTPSKPGSARRSSRKRRLRWMI